jgi:hypothetical protein
MKKAAKRMSASKDSNIPLKKFSYEFYLALIAIVTLATLLMNVILLLRLR